MKRKLPVISMLSLLALMVGMVAPVNSGAQSNLDKASSHRQKTKNGWRNAAAGSGALGVFGVVTGNKTLAAAGLAGAAYSGQRYEHDRRSQRNIDDRRRVQTTTIWHNHHRYRRIVSWHNGARHVRLVRIR